MYENNMSTQEFLYIFYVNLEKKLKRILFLMGEKTSVSGSTEIYETKRKLIEALEILSVNSNDEKSVNNYMYVSSLIASNNKHDLESALTFAKSVRL